MRVGLPLGFFIGPLTPDILAQNDLRRLAALLPGFNLLGLVVTAICSFEPGFSLVENVIEGYNGTMFAYG